MVRIGLLKSKDVSEYCRLVSRVIRATPYYSSEAHGGEIRQYDTQGIRRELRNPRYLYLAAKEKEDIIGFCFGDIQGRVCWMEWIGADPAHRRRGVAGRLLTEFEQRLKKSGVFKIWCDSRPTNRESNALLQKSGFRKVALLKNHWYGLDFYIWEKMLP